MLYEFHHQQSSKHPGSIHATYLLTGVRRASEAVVTADGHSLGVEQNDYMQSSPFMSSSMPTNDVTAESLIKSVMLVREDELDSM
jgi:DNA polymerase delta subunit 3